MATYATASQLIEHLGDELAGQLADPAGGVLADETLLTTILTRASGEMDTYLARRLTVPLDSPTDSFLSWLEQLALDIATYRLFVLRRLGDVEDARRRYEDALAWLRSFAEGAVEAPPPEEPGEEPGPGSPDYYARDQVFTDARLGSF